jgi:hypothetical protein
VGLQRGLQLAAGMYPAAPEEEVEAVTRTTPAALAVGLVLAACAAAPPPPAAPAAAVAVPQTPAVAPRPPAAPAAAVPQTPAVAPATAAPAAAADGARAAMLKQARVRGYRQLERNGKTVYCRNEAELGSRFERTRCVDEDGLAAEMRAGSEATNDANSHRGCTDPACVRN